MIWFWASRQTIHHLMGEVTFWRDAWKAERQRANLAIDRILREKHVQGITAPTMPETMPAPPPEDVEALRELNLAGDVGEFPS